LVLGLQNAGKTPTRRGFLDGIRKMGTYDGAGLVCSAYDVSLKNNGKAPATRCDWYATVKDGKFVLYNKGRPITGELVGDPELLAANKAGNAATVTTAAAANSNP
jgi:hypothetical protein